MAKLRVKLKQHTPLIHFQAEQEGATLRASELKPKLDRFLIETKKLDYTSFLIKSDAEDIKPLDYKVRVLNYKTKSMETEWEKNDKPGEKKNFPLFFGNMGDDEPSLGGNALQNVKQFVWCETPFEVEFFSFKAPLLELIRKYLPEFLMHNNFGTRQSKGFGSFFIADKQSLYNSKQLEESKHLNYQLSVTLDIKKIYGKEEIYNEWHALFYKIALFYNYLRKAQSRNTELPLIKRYAASRGLQWEKDFIKKTLVEDKNLIKPDNVYLMKDLFGLASSEKWGGDTYINKEHVYFDEEKIERYPSPLFFKPLQLEKNKYAVHIEVKDLGRNILNKEFKIFRKESNRSVNIFTPESFDFNDFFSFVMKGNLLPPAIAITKHGEASKAGESND